MDLASWIGFLLCLLFTVGGILLSGSLLDYYDLSSIYITIGGSIGATILSAPIEHILNVPRVIRIAFSDSRSDAIYYINKMLELSHIARKEGLLALENKVEDLDDGFFKKGILLAVDGMESQIIRDILGAEIDALEQRHKEGRGILDTAAALFPAFGMIGTLIGLINMLKVLETPETIGPQMSVALITTFYGVIVANCVCLPLSRKLKAKTEQEVVVMEIVIEGVISIQAGENTRFLEQKLLSYLKPKDKKKVLKEGAKKNEKSRAAVGG